MKLALISLFAGLLALVVIPQDTPADVFTLLQGSTGLARERFGKDEESVRLVDEISGFADALRASWEQSNDRNIPAAYLLTLKFDAGLIEQASSEPGSETSKDLLRYVRDDLQIKRTHAQRIVGAAGGLGASIRVTVKTIKDGQGVSGYLVRCNPRRFANLEKPLFVFNSETDPTSVSSLPPGNYEMWVEKPSGTKVRSKPVTVGGNGLPSMVITFEVP
jgi:hypothetical protein